MADNGVSAVYPVYDDGALWRKAQHLIATEGWTQASREYSFQGPGGYAFMWMKDAEGTPHTLTWIEDDANRGTEVVYVDTPFADYPLLVAMTPDHR